MLIIYRKSNGEVVENQGKNSLFPLGVPGEKSIIQDVISRLGGVFNDYEVVRLHDIENAETVNKTFTHDFSIQNGEVVFGAEKVVEEVPQPPSELEELTNYVLDVDYRLVLVEMGLV